MKYLKQILILTVSIVVLSAWTWRLNMATIFRGENATTMLDEFLVYGSMIKFLCGKQIKSYDF